MISGRLGHSRFPCSEPRASARAGSRTPTRVRPAKNHCKESEAPPGWRLRPRGLAAVLFVPLTVGLVGISGCHKPAPAPPQEEATEAVTSTSAGKDSLVPRSEIPEIINFAHEPDDPDRWLTVEKVKGEAPGAWATGSFDAKRNKIMVRTRDVEQFAIDVSRISIRWDRLVIIAIDGKNSELVRRDRSVLHFVNDIHGWHVVDP
jgi:hypothetical protein